jgi:hypothetical protein
MRSLGIDHSRFKIHEYDTGETSLTGNPPTTSSDLLPTTNTKASFTKLSSIMSVASSVCRPLLGQRIESYFEVFGQDGVVSSDSSKVAADLVIAANGCPIQGTAGSLWMR